MNINEVAKDLASIVKVSQFISEDNLTKLKQLGPTKIAALKEAMDGNDIGTELNHWKVAYCLGKKHFRLF